MNILNKGRCFRCIASKIEQKEIKEIEGMILCSNWLKCKIKNNWCRNCAITCKQPPMGISAKDYEELKNKEGDKK